MILQLYFLFLLNRVIQQQAACIESLQFFHVFEGVLQAKSEDVSAFRLDGCRVQLPKAGYCSATRIVSEILRSRFRSAFHPLEDAQPS